MFFKEDENECIGNSEQVEIPIGRKVFDDLIGGISTVNGSIVEPFDIRYFAYNDYCKQCEDSGGRCGSNQTETSLFVCYRRDHPHILKCNQAFSSLIRPLKMIHAWSNFGIGQRFQTAAMERCGQINASFSLL
ncbi:hypothetical protein ERO13_D09G049950v2 [Gossypium hirsutum]|uniref:Wall-associated receptor kinase C-terminal domain-containing protein n=1 Tax=Gossypium hirsutum TaxID=3635 RepID=A0ABM3AS86_GOSHI|nr:uncharacterized protein LOC121221152 [Gossypium hirsutum]KAG4128949.1 hypothetical protein ERO13_D09G049950v2 [Gossypium hirsutum]